MPYCDVVLEHDCPESPDTALNNVGVKIFYRTYGHGPTKVLLIIGLAGTHESWSPQIKGLTGTTKPNDGGIFADDETSGDIEVCALDNRGMGRSSVLSKRSEYTTNIMAKDAIALLDHLGWKRAHIIGHSMGAMIACTLAGMVPERVLSLALLNVTGGGFECFPKLQLDLQTFSIAMRFFKAKTPEQRASVDLDTHYSKDYLDEHIGTNTRREILYEQYVKGISATGMQSKYGFDGQVNACWLHKLTKTEVDVIRSAGFLVSVIHGRDDVIAQICYARRLAQKLYPVSRMVDLHGGHLVSHERTQEVNQALLELIKASEVNTNPNDWTNLSVEDPGYLMGRITSFGTSSEVKNLVSLAHTAIEKFHHCLLFLFGLLVLAFGYARRAFEVVNPVKLKDLSSPHRQRVFPDQKGCNSSNLELIQV